MRDRPAREIEATGHFARRTQTTSHPVRAALDSIQLQHELLMLDILQLRFLLQLTDFGLKYGYGGSKNMSVFVRKEHLTLFYGGAIKMVITVISLSVCLSACQSLCVSDSQSV